MTSAGHLDHLDGWRGLAIGMLLVGHFFPVPGLNFGQVGVNFFFVLSGWLMARLLFEQEVPIATFYRRRISRIFPAHYVFIGTVLLVFAFAGSPIDWIETAAAGTFTINYLAGHTGHAVMPFGHVWSLCVEEHSYVLLASIAIAGRRGWISPKRAIAACVVCWAAFGVWYWLRYQGRELEFSKWLHTEVSAYGIFASAWLMLHWRERVPRLSFIAYPALLAVGLAMHWWSIASPLREIVGVGAFALLVSLLPAAPRPVLAALSSAPLRRLGMWSFSIYLWQQPFYLYAADDLAARGLALLGAVLAGIASFYVIERPTRSYLNRTWGRQRPGASVTRPSA